MKKIFFILLFCLAVIKLSAQTDGISYQAVIIGPDGQELPGMDAQGNILPGATIAIRFTILDANNSVEYQEVQTANTDQYGRLNLIIGDVDPDGFSLVSWDGTLKRLKVEIDFSGKGTSYVELSLSDLYFLPYAYHRNLVARGTLTVDDISDLNGELTVGGPTNLNSSLNVNHNNSTNLSGPLNVHGITTLGDTLNVNSPESNFAGDINVAPEGTATFNGPTVFNSASQFKDLAVNGPAKLNGQVTVRAITLRDSSDSQYEHYPLLVEGTNQGIAIKVSGSRSIDNNYISFWDENTNQMWGRIEGQTILNLANNREFQVEAAVRALDILFKTFDLTIAGFEVAQAVVQVTAASTSVTPCIGFGACVTAPIPSFIVSETANLILKIANAAVEAGNLIIATADSKKFIDFKTEQIGVTYESGSGDYAEWLPKADPLQQFSPGDLVGVTNGYIVKSTSGADKIMVISTKPLVLGNMPPENKESGYEKVAFMGQVPAKVVGPVEPGDYILPSEIGSGFGKAVHRDDMKITDFKKIAGIAWTASGEKNLNYVNCAVGLNINDMIGVISDQEEKITSLKAEINLLQEQQNQTNDVLCQLVPGFTDALKNSASSLTGSQMKNAGVASVSDQKNLAVPEKKSAAVIEEKGLSIVAPDANDVIYYKVPRELIVAGIEQARKIYLESGKKLEDHPFWKRMAEEPAYVEEIIELVDTKFDEAIKKDKVLNQKFSSTKVSVVKQ